MSLRQRLEYIWDYYKVPLIGVPLALLLFFYVGHSLSADTEPTLFVYLINQQVTEDLLDAFEDSFRQIPGLSDAGTDILVDTSLTIRPSNPDHESQAAFTTAIAGHTVDIMIGDEEFFTYYAKLDAFADLMELLPEDLSRYAAPYLVTAEGPDGIEHAYGLDTSGLSLPPPSDSASHILTVARTTEHTDAVLIFLRAYLQEDLHADFPVT